VTKPASSSAFFSRAAFASSAAMICLGSGRSPSAPKSMRLAGRSRPKAVTEFSWSAGGNRPRADGRGSKKRPPIAPAPPHGSCRSLLRSATLAGLAALKRRAATGCRMASVDSRPSAAVAAPKDRAARTAGNWSETGRSALQWVGLLFGLCRRWLIVQWQSAVWQ